MQFSEIHKSFFNCETGAYSEVTDRENTDSQITLDKDEKPVFVKHFGSSNILHGNRAVDPKLALKKFLLYPEMKPVELNLLFPKHDKPELRLYISKEQGFKPDGGEMWFSFINKSGDLVIGSMPSSEWNKITEKNNSVKTPEGVTTKKISEENDIEVIAIGKHTFEPGAMSIIQMGQELIGHPTTAIGELVKNGYDADATSGKVYFHYESKPEKSFAVIFDNGSGMSDKTLFGSWLQPSVSTKRGGNGLSEIYKRNLLGSKGIGRLAAMALGESVTVITKRSNDSKYNWITVNREDFKVSKLLSQVKFPGDKIDKVDRVFLNDSILTERQALKNEKLTNFLVSNEFSSFQNGTLIIIERLDSAVLKILNQDFVSETEGLQYEQFSYKNTEFYKGLATLITPVSLNDKIVFELHDKNIISVEKNHSVKKGDFNLELGTNLLPDQEGEIIDWLPVAPIPIHSVFDYRAYGKVTRKGNVEGVFVYHRLSNERKEEKFEIPFEDMREKGEQLNLFGSIDTNEVGEYYFDIRIYDMGENDNLEKLARESGFVDESGTANKSQFRSAFKNFQGLRVSKNGFGVKPYGEEIEDWIGLSKQRVMDPGHNVNTNQILGYVFFFSPENNALEEKTNREGFLENTAFIQVRSDLKRIFKNIGILRYNYRVQHSLGRIPKSRHSRPDFETYLDFIKANDDLNQIRKYSEGFMQEVTTSMDNLEESLSFSERLASLGSGIELVYHEMGQPISGLRTTQSSLKLKKDKVNEDIKSNFLYDLEALTHSTDVLMELRKSLQPAIGKSRNKLFKPYDTFLKVCSLFKSDINEFQISIKADVRMADFEIKDLEYAFWIAFLNIINNAIYWIKKSGKGREIKFNIQSNRIIISNTGPMLDPSIIDTLFEYGVTKKTEKGATGLGLAFTRSILSKIDWDIAASNTIEGPAFVIKKQIENE